MVKLVGTNDDNMPGSSLAVTVPAGGVAAGNTLILTVALDPAAGAVTCSDSRANAWTNDADVTRGSGADGIRTVICSAGIHTALVAGDTVVVTHPSLDARSMVVAEVAGYVTPMLDRKATASGDSAAASSGGTATTSQANELLIGAVGYESKHSTDFEMGPDFTLLANVPSGPGGLRKNAAIAAGYRIVSSTGSYSVTGSLLPNRNWAAAIATYKEMCGNAVVEAGEQCDGGACCTASCTFVPAATVCRAAAGVCDVSESCTGASAACPTDIKSTAVCRPAAGVCDVAESCNGVGNDCPADAFVPATTQCRAAAGECDVAESCSGQGPNCPADAKRPAATACTDDGNPCTADVCDGTANVCRHPAGNPGALCRPANGICDVAETCNGTSATCPADAFAPSTTQCRPAAGECDTADFCPGNGATCRPDAVKPAGIACSDDGNVCTTDVCNGTSTACQHSAGNAGALCRAAAGVCDLAERCTGTSVNCPVDVKSTAICRASAGICDTAESCNGSSNDCPADAFRPASTECRAAAGACALAET
jgi:hypothetical protein